MCLRPRRLLRHFGGIETVLTLSTFWTRSTTTWVFTLTTDCSGNATQRLIQEATEYFLRKLKPFNVCNKILFVCLSTDLEKIVGMVVVGTFPLKKENHTWVTEISKKIFFFSFVHHYSEISFNLYCQSQILIVKTSSSLLNSHQIVMQIIKTTDF